MDVWGLSTRAISGVPWEAYDAWNEAIERELFGGQWAGQPVYLDLEPGVLARIALVLQLEEVEPLDSLKAAVSPTLHPQPDGLGFLSEHIRRERAWRIRRYAGTPPFLAVLAFLSAVAEGMRTDAVFRASNYYGRLEDSLGLESDGASHPKIVRGFMEESHVLWAALNSWLEDQEGRLGLPTAYAFDYRIHVGVPMSQALVSAGDRLVLRDLFAAYRLRPGQSLSRSDMLRVIRDWLPASGVSIGLKRLATQREALERIADVASVELRAWDGTPREARAAAASATADLLISAVVRRHPRPRLSLELTVRSLAALPAGEYRLEADTGAHAAAALVAVDGRLTLPEADAEGWRPLPESPLVSMADALFASLRLRRCGTTLRRTPGRLIVLEYDEELRRHVEVNRVTLGRDNLLLCHVSLAPALDELLDGAARPGFIRRLGGELVGLPEAWVAYEPVQILAIPDTGDLDLSALVPLSWTEASLGGGFSLPARLTWLRGLPPELRASSLAERDVSVTLTCERLLEQRSFPPAELATFTESIVVPLNSLDLPDGDYRVAINDRAEGGTTLGSSVFRIRSADHPRLSLDGALGYEPLDSPWAAISASPLRPDGSAVRGAAVPILSHGQLAGSPGGGISEELRLAAAATDEEEPLECDAVPSALGGDAPLCLMGTGAHHWVLEGGHREPWRQSGVEGTCRHCGIDRWFPNRPSGRQRHRQSRGRDGGRRAPVPTLEHHLEAPAIERATWADLDVLLEALSFAQAGSWSGYDSLACRVDDAPWFSLESGRLLAALGHIDIELSGGTVRPERWAIAPSRLVVPEDGTAAFLGGYRSRRLVSLLAGAVTAAGGDLFEHAISGSPSVIEVAGIERSALMDIARAIAEDLEIEMAVQFEPAARLAEQLPDLSQLEPVLARLEHVPDAPLERLDFERGRWERIAEIEGPGAYRVRTLPVLFAASSSERSGLRVGDSRLAKWLAARALGKQLLAYDASTRTLRCPLGAQLPGLYERAAVLASGRPPVQRADGTVTYAGVPPHVAANLWSKLCP